MASRLPPSPAPATFLLSVLFVAVPATAAQPPHVVAVHDGDTLTVLIAERRVRVRLTEIDAPELGQPFGKRSRQSLSEMCFGKAATLAIHSKDRYGRTLAEVNCAGTNANAEQVRQGYAWTYTRYASSDSPLYALEHQARAARRGLWTDPHPVAPWDWRRNTRRPAPDSHRTRYLTAPPQPARR